MMMGFISFLGRWVGDRGGNNVPDYDPRRTFPIHPSHQ